MYARTCSTGRGAQEFVAEAYLLKISGKCQEDQTMPNIEQVIHGPSVPDGEVRFELRMANGAEQARLRIGVRTQPDPSKAVGYAGEPCSFSSLAESPRSGAARV